MLEKRISKNTLLFLCVFISSVDCDSYTVCTLASISATKQKQPSPYVGAYTYFGKTRSTEHMNRSVQPTKAAHFISRRFVIDSYDNLSTSGKSMVVFFITSCRLFF